MILPPSSRLLTRQACLLAHSPRSHANNLVGRAARRPLSRYAGAAESTASSPSSSAAAPLLLAATLLVAADTIASSNGANNNNSAAQCGAAPIGSEPVMLAPSKEPATGILFPRLCNGMTFAGCGVRVKWGFVKVSMHSNTLSLFMLIYFILLLLFGGNFHILCTFYYIPCYLPFPKIEGLRCWNLLRSFGNVND